MTVFHQVTDIKTHISSFTEKNINCDASIFSGYRHMIMLKQMGRYLCLNGKDTGSSLYVGEEFLISEIDKTLQVF